MTLALDIADDFSSVVDGLSPVELIARDSTVTPISNCLRRAITTKEAAASNGQYTTSDVVFHLPVAAVPSQPEVGATIRDADGDWIILESAKQTLNHRYRLVCRNLVIAASLDTLVTIQQVTYTKGTGGAQEPSWAPLYSNLRAKIQIESADRETDHQAKQMPRRATVYFAASLTLTTNHRIVGPNGAIYKILSWKYPDRIDVLYSVQCEVTRWPLD